MQIYDRGWAENYEQLAEAGIPGRAGLYPLCRAVLMDSPDHANILVVGCGTGADLIPLARSFPTWRFDAIEPAKEMLAYCRSEVDRLGLGQRVGLHEVDLASYAPRKRYDAVMSILVSQHLSADTDAQLFFAKLHELILPGGRLFSADIHIPMNHDRERMLDLWERQALMAGTPEEIVTDLRVRFAADLRPRDETMIEGFIANAGFRNLLKPFSSLIYGAWSARKDA